MSEKSYKQGAAFVKTGKALVVNGLAVSLLMGATTSAFAESTVNLAPAQSVAAQNTPVNKDVTAEDVAAAKAKLDQLKQDVATAKAAYDAAVAKHAELVKKYEALTKLSVADAQAKLDAAKARQAGAEKQLAKAQAAADAAPKVTDAAISDAEAKNTAAANALNDAKAAKTAADNELAAAKTRAAEAVTAAQQAEAAVTAANAAATKAGEKVTAAEQTVTAKQRELDELKAQIAQGKDPESIAREKLAREKAALQVAQNEAAATRQAGERAVNDARAKADAAQTEFENSKQGAKDQIAKGSKGFFEAMNSRLAVDAFSTTHIAHGTNDRIIDSTRVGAKGDATSLENMKSAFKYIRQGNAFRTAGDNNFPASNALPVTDYDMAVAQITANYAVTNFAHPKFGFENLSAGRGNPFTRAEASWYTSEKAEYDRRGSGVTGHYTALMNNDYGFQSTGFGIASPAGSQYGVYYAHQFTLRGSGKPVDTNRFTVDEYEARFDRYYEPLKAAAENGDAAKKQKADEARAAVTAAEQKATTDNKTANDKVTAAQAAVTKAEGEVQNAPSANAAKAAAEQALNSAKTARDNAQAEKTRADQALTDANAAKDRAAGAAQQANNAVPAAQTKADNATASVRDAQTKADTAAAELTKVKADKQKADAAAVALNAAKTEKATADAAIAPAEKAVADARANEAEAAKLKSDYEAAQQQIAPLKAASEAAQAKADAQQKVYDALLHEFNTVSPSTAKIAVTVAGEKDGATVTTGAEVKLQASGFKPNEQVTVEIHSTPVTLGTVPADQAGVATYTWKVPADFTLGAHQAIFKAKKAKGSSEFKVVAPAVVTPPPGQPPVTTPPATPPAGQPPVTPPAGQPPVTPPTGQPPVTPPTSEPPVTTPPTGQPPVTPPPAGQPPVTTPPAGEPSTTTGTPARDGKGNILANTGVAGAPVGVLVGATLLAAAGVLLIGRRKRTSAS